MILLLMIFLAGIVYFFNEKQRKDLLKALKSFFKAYFLIFYGFISLIYITIVGNQSIINGLLSFIILGSIFLLMWKYKHFKEFLYDCKKYWLS